MKDFCKVLSIFWSSVFWYSQESIHSFSIEYQLVYLEFYWKFTSKTKWVPLKPITLCLLSTLIPSNNVVTIFCSMKNRIRFLYHWFINKLKSLLRKYSDYFIVFTTSFWINECLGKREWQIMNYNYATQMIAAVNFVPLKQGT